MNRLDEINNLVSRLEDRGRKTVKIEDINKIIFGYGMDVKFIKLR